MPKSVVSRKNWRGRRPARRLTIWQASQTSSPSDVVNLVAAEGVCRLLFERMWPEVERATEAIAPGVGDVMAGRLNDFIVDLATEAAWVGAGLSAALADEGCQHRSFEGWLAAAIAKAGLAGYTPSTRLELPGQT